MTVERTFAFVDLAGFTALTETHGDVSAADLVHAFYDLAAGAVVGGGELVKCIGDAVMLAHGAPGDAVEAAHALLTAAHDRDHFPLLRAGLHHGTAVGREGDYFGTAVNVAARVAAQARGGQVLATAVVARAAAEGGHEVVALGGFDLPNRTEAVELFELRIGPPVEHVTIDPVCRMRVDRERAAGRLRHGHRDYWFCSLECASRFAGGPDRWVDAGDGPAPARR